MLQAIWTGPILLLLYMCVNEALRDQHGFAEKRASRWIQFYLDTLRIRARTVIAQDVVGEEGEGVHIQQSAAVEWIKAQGWGCIADKLQNLLQHDTVHNGVRVPWGEGFRQWGVLLGKAANLVWGKGILTGTRVNQLRADLIEGNGGIASGFGT